MNKEYIDKHEAYLLLKHKAETYMLPATKEAYEIAAILIDSIKTHEVQPIDRWISVKDRLPENDCLYIVCKTVKGHRISFEARWKGNKWLSVVNNNQLDYVTHWQPLPEPPKEV